MTSPSRQILFLDIDGVLHGRDAAFAIADVKLPVERLLEAGLLSHRGSLVELLEAYPAVEVVVHSAWRWTHTRDELAGLLGPLGPRLAGATPRELDREASILAWMTRRGIPLEQVVVLDDQPELFKALSRRLVVCDPVLGVSAPHVLPALIRALDGIAASIGPTHTDQ